METTLRNRSRTGVRYEREYAELQRALGYYVVRSAGSRGPFDLVVVGPWTVSLVQVKYRQDLRFRNHEFRATLEALEPWAWLHRPDDGHYIVIAWRTKTGWFEQLFDTDEPADIWPAAQVQRILAEAKKREAKNA